MEKVKKYAVVEVNYWEDLLKDIATELNSLQELYLTALKNIPGARELSQVLTEIGRRKDFYETQRTVIKNIFRNNPGATIEEMVEKGRCEVWKHLDGTLPPNEAAKDTDIVKAVLSTLIPPGVV